MTERVTSADCPRAMPVRLLATVLLALLAVGCAARKPKAVRRATPVASGPQMVGTVALVNEEGRFVLVDVGSLYSPTPGTALKCFYDGEETAVLAVTAERMRPHIAADIVKGTPHRGDKVFE